MHFKTHVKTRLGVNGPRFGQRPVWSVTGLGDFLHFGQFFKACGKNYFAQIVHILGNFCKGVQIIHFSSEIIFGQLLLTFVRLFISHTACVSQQVPYIIITSFSPKNRSDQISKFKVHHNHHYHLFFLSRQQAFSHAIKYFLITPLQCDQIRRNLATSAILKKILAIFDGLIH